jgi:hypothetical protein
LGGRGPALVERAVDAGKRATLALLPPVVTKAADAPTAPRAITWRRSFRDRGRRRHRDRARDRAAARRRPDLRGRLKACETPDPIAAARRVVSARFDAITERQAGTLAASLRGVDPAIAAAVRQVNADQLVAAKQQLLHALPDLREQPDPSTVH